MWKNYWESYYKRNSMPKKPSLFSKWCLDNYIKKGNSIIELGCGSGSDSFFFASNNIKVRAIDQCKNELSVLSKEYSFDNLEFICSDFTNLFEDNIYDAVYSRFTLHSVDAYGEDRVIKWCFDHIKFGGYLLIEVRGKKNELYGKGVAVKNEEDAFIYENHYRRFIDFENIQRKLVRAGFKIKFAKESNGFSPYNGKDEIFLRIVGEKKRS